MHLLSLKNAMLVILFNFFVANIIIRNEHAGIINVLIHIGDYIVKQVKMKPDGDICTDSEREPHLSVASNLRTHLEADVSNSCGPQIPSHKLLQL